jgi:hypothetical protein
MPYTITAREGQHTNATKNYRIWVVEDGNNGAVEVRQWGSDLAHAADGWCGRDWHQQPVLVGRCSSSTIAPAASR